MTSKFLRFILLTAVVGSFILSISSCAKDFVPDTRAGIADSLVGIWVTTAKDTFTITKFDYQTVNILLTDSSHSKLQSYPGVQLSSDSSFSFTGQFSYGNTYGHTVANGVRRMHILTFSEIFYDHNITIEGQHSYTYVATKR